MKMQPSEYLTNATLDKIANAILDENTKFSDLVAIVLDDPLKTFDCRLCAGRFMEKLLRKTYETFDAGEST